MIIESSIFEYRHWCNQVICSLYPIHVSFVTCSVRMGLFVFHRWLRALSGSRLGLLSWAVFYHWVVTPTDTAHMHDVLVRWESAATTIPFPAQLTRRFNVGLGGYFWKRILFIGGGQSCFLGCLKTILDPWVWVVQQGIRVQSGSKQNRIRTSS